jgi:hypothetical protein
MKGGRIAILAVICTVLLFGMVMAQGYYDWMPKGGCLLLVETLDRCADCDDIQAILKAKRTQEEWKAFFQGKQGAFAGLTEKQVKTLVAYLAVNMPVAGVNLPEDQKKIDCSALPLDGRIQTLESCTLCHPVGPALTQDKDIAGWRGLYGRTPHDEVELSQKAIETLSYYLFINTPMAMEEIPEEHRVELPGF